MHWYVASVVSVVQLDTAEQDEFPVFEEHYLVSASSDDQLREKIERIKHGMNEAGAVEYRGKPARIIALGTRKIRSIFNETGRLDEDPPTDFTELTRSCFVVGSLADARLFASGAEMKVTYDDERLRHQRSFPGVQALPPEELTDRRSHRATFLHVTHKGIRACWEPSEADILLASGDSRVGALAFGATSNAPQRLTPWGEGDASGEHFTLEELAAAVAAGS